MLGVLSISSSKKACVAYTVVFPLPSWLLSRNWAVSEFNLFYYFFDPGAKEVDCLF